MIRYNFVKIWLVKIYFYQEISFYQERSMICFRFGFYTTTMLKVIKPAV